MFDYIDYTHNCPNCNSLVDSFQCKDNKSTYRTISPLLSKYFYSVCYKCGCWIEFVRIYDRVYLRHVSDKRGDQIHKYTKKVVITDVKFDFTNFAKTSMLPLIESKGNEIQEVTICESMFDKNSGYRHGLPVKLTLCRKLKDGTTYRMEYIQNTNWI